VQYLESNGITVTATQGLLQLPRKGAVPCTQGGSGKYAREWSVSLHGTGQSFNFASIATLGIQGEWERHNPASSSIDGTVQPSTHRVISQELLQTVSLLPGVVNKCNSHLSSVIVNNSQML
jgi:hypothetical protein